MYEATLEQLAYHTLERQGLIERAPSADACRVIEDVCGLNAQGALNYNLSLWARVEGLDNRFIRDSIRGKTLLRSWFMRNTVHIMTTAQAFVARPALRESLLHEWNRWTVRTGSKESPDSWNAHYGEVLAALEDGPLSLSELLERYSPTSEKPRRILSRVVREMSLKGLVCNGEPRGPWYHDTEQTYTEVKRWVPGMTEAEEPGARETLMMGYLRGYGPARVQDYAYWAGLKVSAARKVLRRIESGLEAVEAVGQKGKLYIPLTLSQTWKTPRRLRWSGFSPSSTPSSWGTGTRIGSWTSRRGNASSCRPPRCRRRCSSTAEWRASGR